MKNALTLLFLFSLIMSNMKASSTQSDIPYSEIPPAPEIYTPANVAARMIDGLGFRFYWTTEGLRPEDLKYKPSEDARTTDETLDHIYELSVTISNVAKKIPTDRSEKIPQMTFEEKRKRTLENLKTASDLLKASNGDLENFLVLFKKEDGVSENPFWNIINGMITDAIWHTGQIVSFRRASGNPIRSGVNYFNGTVK